MTEIKNTPLAEAIELFGSTILFGLGGRFSLKHRIDTLMLYYKSSIVRGEPGKYARVPFELWNKEDRRMINRLIDNGVKEYNENKVSAEDLKVKYSDLPGTTHGVYPHLRLKSKKEKEGEGNVS